MRTNTCDQSGVRGGVASRLRLRIPQPASRRQPHEINKHIAHSRQVGSAWRVACHCGLRIGRHAAAHFHSCHAALGRLGCSHPARSPEDGPHPAVGHGCVSALGWSWLSSWYLKVVSGLPQRGQSTNREWPTLDAAWQARRRPRDVLRMSGSLGGCLGAGLGLNLQVQSLDGFAQRVPRLFRCAVHQAADGCLSATHDRGDLWLGQVAKFLNFGEGRFPIHAAMITTSRYLSSGMSMARFRIL